MIEERIPSRTHRAVWPLSLSAGNDPVDTSPAFSGLKRHHPSGIPAAGNLDAPTHTARPPRSHPSLDATAIQSHDCPVVNRRNATLWSTK